MPRKHPYQHPVKGHTRSGITVHRYTRGRGNKPNTPSKTGKDAPGQTGYTVSILFSGSGKENYNVAGGTYTGASKDGLTRIQRPEIPHRVQIRRLSK